MSRRHAKVSLKPGQSRAALTITHPNAAGIDIGSAAHFVAVPPDRDDTPVRELPSFTKTDQDAPLLAVGRNERSWGGLDAHAKMKGRIE